MSELRIAPAAPGERVNDDLEVISHLRRGNDLDVYDAWSHGRGARCVVKALRPDRLDRTGTVAALIREGEMLERFSHPHIVRAYETISEPLPAVVLETLGGLTLGALIDDEGPAEREDIGHLGLHLGSAIRYMHAHGVLHLDLKPSNVIAEAGRAKLIDLSLARPPGPVSPGVGTADYLSPEQARGGDVGPAADVWGIGVLLFEAATGEAPFDDDPIQFSDCSSESEGTDSDCEPDSYPQLERQARRADSFATVDVALADLIDRCLAPDSAARPGLEELLRDLEALAEVPASERRWT